MRLLLKVVPLFALVCGASARAAELVTLQSGSQVRCDHSAADGARTRLYLDAASTSYVDVGTSAVVSVEKVSGSPTVPSPAAPSAAAQKEVLTASELHEVLTGVGKPHDLDVDLLASGVHAESGSRVHARSRVGAQGLMQLMPATAAELGVRDAWVPEQNVGGGAAYLDALLHRYHDNIALALAAYNAGPGAVDKYHGVPPYRETRAYVARIVHEFNQRYAARQAAAALASAVRP